MVRNWAAAGAASMRSSAPSSSALISRVKNSKWAEIAVTRSWIAW